MIRFGIVHEISGGLYTFSRGKQGRFHYDTKEDTEHYKKAVKRHEAALYVGD